MLRLHRSIGKYRRLWGLLFEGRVGWSALKVIAPFVTSDTVG